MLIFLSLVNGKQLAAIQRFIGVVVVAHLTECLLLKVDDQSLWLTVLIKVKNTSNAA